MFFYRKESGVTLIESMATLAIVAIVSSIAIPSFASMHRQVVRTTVINDFVHTMYLARSEAIKRNSVVSVCRSNDGTSCANDASNWNGGWIVFENLDHDQPANTDPGEPILWRQAPLADGQLTSNRVSFSFRPFAQADITGTLVFCPKPGASNEARAIIVNHTGRVRTSSKDASGKALKC